MFKEGPGVSTRLSTRPVESAPHGPRLLGANGSSCVSGLLEGGDDDELCPCIGTRQCKADTEELCGLHGRRKLVQISYHDQDGELRSRCAHFRHMEFHVPLIAGACYSGP